ncbi:WPP domain-interacting protein 2-like [Actinidia eriantha]|uniref:WPP domain-interacting protein 2-like n=1 Tax=Actinidia eriantha TaxID=165200 RepID=UPI002588C1C7|nr:WPP domain-interacting protein 2-like [Actinidia eriantha]XP_057461900.1 WPP domain-interacting protein 2-like [Actinidia eriantha]
MDLESECSGLESVEDNEVIAPENLENTEEKRIENNGSCVGEHSYDELLGDMKEEDIGVTGSPSTVKAPTGGPTATAKGYGLKKWRRIRREFTKDGRSNVDTGKILKRGLSTPITNSTRPQGLSVDDMKQKSEDSLSSTSSMGKNLGFVEDGFALHGSGLDSRFAVGSSFAAGTDSENSEDQSSKSSTAASVPKLRYEIPAVVGYARDKNKMRSLSGKNVVNAVQRGQQGKSRVETSKKPRGEWLKIEKENSHSSMESDSRSSNFVFVQGTNSVTSNGIQMGQSTNDNGEHSDESEGGEQHLGEELQNGYSKENVGGFEDLSEEDVSADSSWKVKEEKVESHRSSTELDPLVESIFSLQSAQEALEKEVEKLREIGNERISLFDDSTRGSSLPLEFASVDPRIHEASSSDMLHSGEITQNSSHFLEKQVISLEQKVNLLESKLEEVNAVLEEKETKVIELECALMNNESPKEEMWRTVESQQKKYGEMEAELEGLFKQKIEAEVEYLAISRTIQKLRVAAGNQVAIFEEQKALALQRPQIFNGLGDSESKAEKLETYSEDIVRTNQVLKLQKRVCKVTTCFFIQSILLFVVCVLFFMQLSPHYVGVVPT